MESITHTSVSNLNLLRGLTRATQENIQFPDIQERIKQVANSLIQPIPELSVDQIKTLPKVVKLSIVKSAIDNVLDQDNSEVLQNLKKYVDLDIISNLLGEPTERYGEMIEEYYAKMHTLSLHGDVRQEEIENRISKLSPAVKASITKLDLSDCFYLTSLSFLEQFPRITDLNLSYASSLRSLEGIQNLNALSTLNLTSCRALLDLNGLESNKNLKVLVARECSYLSDIDSIARCNNLEELDLSQCNQLKKYDPISTLQNLKKLGLKGLAHLKTNDLTHVCKELFNLEELHLENSGVKDISSLSELPRLRTESIYAKGCRIPPALKTTLSTTD